MNIPSNTRDITPMVEELTKTMLDEFEKYGHASMRLAEVSCDAAYEVGRRFEEANYFVYVEHSFNGSPTKVCIYKMPYCCNCCRKHLYKFF